MPSPAARFDVASVLMRLRLSADDIAALQYAIKEARALDALCRAGDGGRGSMLELVRAANRSPNGLVVDLPSVFLHGSAAVRAAKSGGLSTALPCTELFPLRAHFTPACGFMLRPDVDWVNDLRSGAFGGDAIRTANDSPTPRFRLEFPLRVPPADDIERCIRCCTPAGLRRRKDRVGFRYHVDASAVPYAFHDGTPTSFTYRGGMTPQWLTGYAFALRDPLAPRSVRFGEFGKPVSLHIGWLSEEQMAGGSSGFYAVLVAKKPSTIVKANQLPKPDASRPKLLPNGKRHYLPWPKELEQFSLLPAE